MDIIYKTLSHIRLREHYGRGPEKGVRGLRTFCEITSVRSEAMLTEYHQHNHPNGS